MRIVKIVKSDGTEQYFNVESFLKAYLSKVNSDAYIVFVEFSSNEVIQMNTNPVCSLKAAHLEHKFLALLLNPNVKMIAIDARNDGLVDKAIYIKRF